MSKIRGQVRQKFLSSDCCSFDEHNVDAAVDKVMKLPKPQVKFFLESPLAASAALTQVAGAMAALEETEETVASMNRIRMKVRKSLRRSLQQFESFSDDDIEFNRRKSFTSIAVDDRDQIVTTTIVLQKCVRL